MNRDLIHSYFDHRGFTLTGNPYKSKSNQLNPLLSHLYLNRFALNFKFSRLPKGMLTSEYVFSGLKLNIFLSGLFEIRMKKFRRFLKKECCLGGLTYRFKTNTGS